MAQPATLSPVGSIVRRADADRFLTALFAPADKREALFTLYAFNHEAARAREVATQPMLALIRLQWWREVVEGASKPHEVATPLRALLDAGVLDPAELLAVLDGHEVTKVADLAAWRQWLFAGAGSLALAAARVLGAPDAPGLQAIGAAYGAAGMLRSVAAMGSRGLCLLPAELLSMHGFTAEAVAANPASPALQPVFTKLAKQARAWLGAPARRGPALAAALPAALARRDLRHPGRATPRGLGDRLAVTAAALTGRV
jgi:phytoene synthase